MCDEDSQEMNIRPESLTVHVSCVCAMWALLMSLVCSVLSTCAGALVEEGSQRTGHSSEVCITNPLLLRVMQSSRQR